jgi:hypothetical protein
LKVSTAFCSAENIRMRLNTYSTSVFLRMRGSNVARMMKEFICKGAF